MELWTPSGAMIFFIGGMMRFFSKAFSPQK